MKTKVLQVFLVALFTVAAIGVKAQQVQPIDKVAEKITEKMTKALSLSKDQADKVKPIVEKYAKSAYDIMDRNKGNKEELTRQLKENSASQEVDLRKIFDEKQYNKYLQLKDQFIVKAKQKLTAVKAPAVPDIKK